MTDTRAFCAILESHIATRADHVAIRFLERGEAVTREVTYGALGDRVAALAAGIHHEGLKGMPVVLALPPGVEFIVALLACLRAGAVAVPVPSGAVGAAAVRRDLVIADLRAGAILIPESEVVETAGLRRLDPAEIATPSRALPPLPTADDPAVIQYSSGSTRSPLGIVISHGNIAANQVMIDEIFAMGPQDVVVSWLPPHHDMGLFGTILHPLYVGASTVLMPPMAFIQKPVRWLEAISRYRGTVAGSPNFGYDLCVRRVAAEKVSTLDLSSLQIAFCGAEPIRAASLDRFSSHFAAARFDPGALLPCYGLAEATLLATSVRKRTGVKEVLRPGESGERAHVSCGHPPVGCRITIRDAETSAVQPAGTLGEICVAGAHVAIGSWDGERGDVAPLPGVQEDDGERRFHSGDIGLMTDDGLLVLDRIKDIIIVHGHNIYAADAEDAAIVAGGPALAAVAAFASSGASNECLVMLCEIARAAGRGADHEQLRRTIREAVAQRCGIVPEVEFVDPGALPRTTSGKIRRQEARRAHANGQIPYISTQEPSWANG